MVVVLITLELATTWATQQFDSPRRAAKDFNDVLWCMISPILARPLLEYRRERNLMLSKILGLNERTLQPAGCNFRGRLQPPTIRSTTPLQQHLKGCHVAMISIGGVIGTGLFLGTATALLEGGPVGLLLRHTFMGTLCYCVMITAREMIALLPIPGGHIRLAERFVDPAFSFTMGWNCWYCWTVRSELSAAATLIDHWNPGVNNGLWITMCLVVAVGINLFSIDLASIMSIKVVMITGLLILGIVLDLAGSPSYDCIGFRYWKDPGPFVQFDGIAGAKGWFLGFIHVLIQATFSFIGTKVVTMAAAEMKNPQYTMPRAIQMAGIRYLPLVFQNLNAVILTLAWSASSSNLYLSSRGLYGLAATGNAPKFFMRTSRSGHPYVTIVFCSLFSLSSYVVVSTSSGIVFTWFANMTATTGLLAWFCIGVTHVWFCQRLLAQEYDRKHLPYASCRRKVFLKVNWSNVMFMTTCLPVMLLPVLYMSVKFMMRVPLVKPCKMGFNSRTEDIEPERYSNLLWQKE
ncbi:amino acid permease [Suillus lakei]|nr:amino acid permease [Suillus lakei]